MPGCRLVSTYCLPSAPLVVAVITNPHVFLFTPTSDLLPHQVSCRSQLLFPYSRDLTWDSFAIFSKHTHTHTHTYTRPNITSRLINLNLPKRKQVIFNLPNDLLPAYPPPLSPSPAHVSRPSHQAWLGLSVLTYSNTTTSNTPMTPAHRSAI